MDLNRVRETVEYSGQHSKSTTSGGSCALFEYGKLCHKDVVMAGFAGLSGSAAIARAKKKELLGRYPEVFIDKAVMQVQFLLSDSIFTKEQELQNILPEAATAVKSDECGLFRLSEGGVFAGLWNMAETAGVGLEIELRKIPVKQETIEICNFFDINPYILKSDGSYLILTDNGYRLVHELEKKNIEAVVIGITMDNNDKVVINGEEKRFLEKRYQDNLYQVLP